VSQRLIPTVTDERCAAFEIMLSNPMIAQLILRGEFEGIKEMMKTSESNGMKTFDSALFELYQEGLIDEEEAIRNADSQNNVRLKIQIATEAVEEASTVSDFTGLGVEEVDEGEYRPV
jgi:twitching motility protein PilU